MNADFARHVAALKSFLEAPERRGVVLDIDSALGAMVAFNSTPVSISDVELGFLILRNDVDSEELWFEDKEVRHAWVGCLNELGQMLYDQTYDLRELYGLADEMSEPPEAFRRWCDGYLRGYMLTESDWQEGLAFLATEKLSDLGEEHESFLSILAFFAQWETELLEHSDPKKLKEGVPLLIEAIVGSVFRFHGIALVLEENRLHEEEGRSPLVRGEEKTGRNDPCPCGSGKKFKRCCLQ